MIILITKEESDTFLAAYSDWVALDDSIKDDHIKKSSIYSQSRWKKEDLDWEDINDDVKEAVAFYAYASFSGQLFGQVNSPNPKIVKREYQKVGSMVSDTEYLVSSGSNNYTTSFGYPDSILRLNGFYEDDPCSLTRS